MRLTSNELEQKPEHIWRQLAWNSVSHKDFKPCLISETKKKLNELIHNIDSPSADQLKVIDQLRNMDQFDPKVVHKPDTSNKAKSNDSANSASIRETFRQFQRKRNDYAEEGESLSFQK